MGCKVSTFLFSLFLICSARENGESKRLLLHSDEDIAAEIVNLKDEIGSLKTEISLLKSSSRDSGKGTVYIHWGSSICPKSAELLYKGYTAGKLYSDAASGTDTLCLPDDPVWGTFHDGVDYLRGSIYGSEIDHEDTHNLFSRPVNQQDMPCAVCKTNKTQTLMIPARNVCYQGWTVEYSGYLMANGHISSHYGYNHICLDSSPEFLAHGGTNDDQHILYVVEARCGSLPCPPYVDGRELTCVVCSQ